MLLLAACVLGQRKVYEAQPPAPTLQQDVARVDIVLHNAAGVYAPQNRGYRLLQVPVCCTATVPGAALPENRRVLSL